MYNGLRSIHLRCWIFYARSLTLEPEKDIINPTSYIIEPTSYIRNQIARNGFTPLSVPPVERILKRVNISSLYQFCCLVFLITSVCTFIP